MPEYDFKCPKCGEEFSKRTSMSGREGVRCPKCGEKPEQVFRKVNVNTGAGCG